MHLQPNTKLQNGKITILKKLGSGGFGITYLAEHSLLGKVALKEFFLSTANKYCTRSHQTVIPTSNLTNIEFDKFKQDFINEARTLYQLKDIPSVVNVYDYFEENNTVYFYMDYIDGESLQKLVNRQGKLPLNKAIFYIQQVGAALIKVHKKGILHRDIKPENIIINTQNRAVLIDFGIARDFVEGETKTHTGMATMGYAPPEQLVKRAKRGAYTDIFSMGGTLYFCLTGQRPQNKDEIDLDGFLEPKDLNSDIPNRINDTIVKAIKRRPIERFQKIEDFLAGLNKITIHNQPLYKEPQTPKNRTSYQEAPKASYQEKSKVKVQPKTSSHWLLASISWMIVYFVYLLGYSADTYSFSEDSLTDAFTVGILPIIVSSILAYFLYNRIEQKPKGGAIFSYYFTVSLSAIIATFLWFDVDGDSDTTWIMCFVPLLFWFLGLYIGYQRLKDKNSGEYKNRAFTIRFVFCTAIPIFTLFLIYLDEAETETGWMFLFDAIVMLIGMFFLLFNKHSTNG